MASENADLSKAFEEALRSVPAAPTHDPCKIFRQVSKPLRDELGKLIGQQIGEFGEHFYSTLILIAEEHCSETGKP